MLLAAGALFMLAGSLLSADRVSLRRLLTEQRSKATIAAEFVLGAAGATGVILLMEGYETHFGGLSPFDAHAVLMHDAPATIVLYVAVFAIARWLIDRFARIAAAARLFFGAAFTLICRHASGGAPLRRHRSKPVLSPARNVCSRQGELRAPPLTTAFS